MMKLRIAAFVCLGVVAAQTYAADTQTSPIEQNKLSYSIGVDIGNNFKNQNIQIDPTVLMQGINDALNSRQLLISQAEVNKTLQAFQTQLINQHQAELVQQAEQNQQASEKFLAENKTKPGVISLANGLQYKVIQAGSGPKPTEQDSVTVEYTGRLLDGKVFDSSAEHGGKVTFQVSEVISGWQEALKLMPVGSTWEIFVPANLAYGERGTSGLIGPNQTLVFDLHLLEINPNKLGGTEPSSTTN